MVVLREVSLPIRDESGAALATLRIVPVQSDERSAPAPLVRVSEDEAKEFGENEVQLLEGERYEYELTHSNHTDLQLASSLLLRRTKLRSSTATDAGTIETGDYCGALHLTLVVGDSDVPVGATYVEVRSRKLDYRSEYRGMLDALSERLSALVLDARSSVKATLRSNLARPLSPGALQVQLELLREAIEGSAFHAAIERITRFTHERMAEMIEVRPAGAPGRWLPKAVRKLTGPGAQRQLAPSHPLASSQGIRSVVERIETTSKGVSIDTPENRFVKFVLVEWRELLTGAARQFGGSREWQSAARVATRLAEAVDVTLQRPMFREIGALGVAPLGSPVLQRKSGYREILRYWLKLHAAAEMSWEAGEELFKAGERRVATLYEYWLFFALLEWFAMKCRGGSHPPLESLLDGLEDGAFRLRLKRGKQLGPFDGEYERSGRRLKARFSYNKRFAFAPDHTRAGSWTRTLNPDYTLSFWPAELSEEEAEESELLVHVHFDAKYRVESVEQLFGGADDDGTEGESDTTYRRQDLLKMHAYRDAIRRSQGAYVIYPGRGAAPTLFKGFYHEILPGLGAFGIAPDAQGKALGMPALADFLDDVLGHLSNRTTAQERISYHTGRAYSVREAPVEYGDLRLDERDSFDELAIATPTAEQIVLIVDVENEPVVEWTRENGCAIVRLPNRHEGASVTRHFGAVRHILFRSTATRALAAGLCELSQPGFAVVTRADLTAMRYPEAAPEAAFALFRVREASALAGAIWDSSVVERLLRSETGEGVKTVKTIGTSVITLRDLLAARIQ